jgi:hypothetical protein
MSTLCISGAYCSEVHHSRSECAYKPKGENARRSPPDVPPLITIEATEYKIVAAAFPALFHSPHS